MNKITTHLWFDTQAKEAAEFYASLFPNSNITSANTLHNTPSGDTDIISFELAGQPFMAISAGPVFKFNPSISFHVKFKTKEEVDAAWEKLSQYGKPLMPLGSYSFSERYGWIQDRYGLSWQLIYAGGNEFKQTITPLLMFTQAAYGKAEEAFNFYASVFKSSPPNIFARYGTGQELEKEGTVKYAQVTLLGQDFGAMDSAQAHDVAFNEAISFIVSCETQEEIDYYWEKLSAVPGSEQCGWLKDKYGLSWQITPMALGKMIGQGTQEQVARVTQAFLNMKKIDIATLESVYNNIKLS